MPTLRKDRGNGWMARVLVDGRQVAAQMFPPGKKHGPQWRAAKQWEEEQTQKHREGYQQKPTLTAFEQLLGWDEKYLAHVQRTMNYQAYGEKKAHLQAFFIFCRKVGVLALDTVSKPKAYQFLAGIRDAKEAEAKERLVVRPSASGDTRQGANSDAKKPEKGGKIGNPASVANKYRKNLLAAWNWGIDYVEEFPQGKSPFAMVKAFPCEKEERYVPPEEDVIKVLELAKGQDLVMLMVFYYTGARAGEVFKLSWQRDVNLDAGTIRLEDRKTPTGKKRVRWQAMHPELTSALSWWLHARPCRVDNVFMQVHCDTAMGKPFRHRSKFCGRLCERAGVKPFVFYSIRHTSAHITFREGGVSAAKSLLGHYHATTTNTYLQSMGMYTDQGAIQDSLGKSDIGQATARLMDALLTVGSTHTNGHTIAGDDVVKAVNNDPQGHAYISTAVRGRTQ